MTEHNVVVDTDNLIHNAPKVTVRSVTMEEAVEHIQKDTDALSFLNTHGGFFSPELPFRHPMHIKDRKIIVWPPADISPTAEIGENVMIGRYTNIMGTAKIGDWCRIQGFCFIPPGVTIGERVFIGPNVTFTNMTYPKVQKLEDKNYEKTVVENMVSIGAGVVICPGVTIGEGAMIGAGAVVVKDVKPGATVVGCPAKEIKKEK